MLISRTWIHRAEHRLARPRRGRYYGGNLSQWVVFLAVLSGIGQTGRASDSHDAPKETPDPMVVDPHADRSASNQGISDPPLLQPSRLNLACWPDRQLSENARDLVYPDIGQEHILWAILRSKAEHYSGQALRNLYREQYAGDPVWQYQLMEDRAHTQLDPHKENERYNLIQESAENPRFNRFGGVLAPGIHEDRVFWDYGYWTVDEDLQVEFNFDHLLARVWGRSTASEDRPLGLPVLGDVRDFLVDERIQLDLDFRVDLESSPTGFREVSPFAKCEGRLRMRWTDAGSAAPIEGVLKYEWRPLAGEQVSLNLVKSF